MEIPPYGSKIRIETDGGDPTIIIPPTIGFARYPSGLFLLCWLVGWAFGFQAVATELIYGKFQLFLAAWLVAWTLAGIFAVIAVYRTFRPSVPETLELRRNSVGYDSGIAPPQFNRSERHKNPWANWKSMFAGRRRLELDRSRLQSLRLRETETGNRLTFDLDSERIEIAATASEVEREWLARLLAHRYSLPQILGAAKPAEADA
jgi:hypothetical protein